MSEADSADPERRRFLFRALLAFQSLWVALAGLPVLCTLLAPLTGGGTDAGWIRAGSETEVPEGGTVLLRYRRRWRDGYREASASSVAVVSRHGGALTALSAVCTHLGCLVALDRANGQLACPCHGGRFGLDGRVLAGPPPRPLEPLDVKVEGGAVWIRPRATIG